MTKKAVIIIILLFICSCAVEDNRNNRLYVITRAQKTLFSIDTIGYIDVKYYSDSTYHIHRDSLLDDDIIYRTHFVDTYLIWRVDSVVSKPILKKYWYDNYGKSWEEIVSPDTIKGTYL